MNVTVDHVQTEMGWLHQAMVTEADSGCEDAEDYAIGEGRECPLSRRACSHKTALGTGIQKGPG